MATASNCNIPEELLYWVREHVWVRPEADGTVTIGMTDAAQALAGIIVTATPKATGRKVKRGRSTGTVESGKWVGPIKSPVTGEIIDSNQAVVSDPKILNRDPYGAGWFVRVNPVDWDDAQELLVTGDQAVSDYAAFLQEKGIDCSQSPGGGD